MIVEVSVFDYIEWWRDCVIEDIVVILLRVVLLSVLDDGWFVLFGFGWMVGTCCGIGR